MNFADVGKIGEEESLNLAAMQVRTKRKTIRKSANADYRKVRQVCERIGKTLAKSGGIGYDGR